MNVIFGKTLKLSNIFLILLYFSLISFSFGKASQISHQNFQFQFLDPTDKSSFSIDDEITITWDSEEGMGLNDPIKSIDIFYCLNKGYDCIKIDNVNFSENSFFWLIPDVSNERIYIKGLLNKSNSNISTVPIEINIINNQNSVENNNPKTFEKEEVDPVNSKTVNQHYFQDLDIGLYVTRDPLNNIIIKWNQQDSYVKIYAFDSERLIRSQNEIKKGHNLLGTLPMNNAYIDINKYTKTNKDLTIQIINEKNKTYDYKILAPINNKRKTINQFYSRDFDLGLYVSRDQMNNIRIKWNKQDSYVKIYAFDSERLIRSQNEIKEGHNLIGTTFNNSAYIRLDKYTKTNKDLTIQIINHMNKTYDYKILTPISTSNNFTSSYKNKSADWASEENKGQQLSFFGAFLLIFFSLIALNA